MFTQDKNDDFDWTRHSAATRDTKYTPNTGPSGDRSGSKQGKEFENLTEKQKKRLNTNCSENYPEQTVKGRADQT